MNWLDIALLLSAVSFAFSGYRQGFVAGVLAFTGFLIGGVAGLLLAPRVVSSLDPEDEIPGPDGRRRSAQPETGIVSNDGAIVS